MKPLGYILAVALLATFAATFPATPAAAHGSLDLALSGGAAIPMDQFSDKDKLDAKAGPLAGFEVSYGLSPTIAVGVDGSWSRNKHATEGSVVPLGGGATLTANKDRYSILHVGAHCKFLAAMAGSVKPYGLLGVGLYDFKEDFEYTQFDGVTTTVFTDESEAAAGTFEQAGSRWGFRVGAGADYMASSTLGIGVSVDYNSVVMDQKKFGVSAAPYLGVRGKVTYHVGGK